MGGRDRRRARGSTGAHAPVNDEPRTVGKARNSTDNDLSLDEPRTGLDGKTLMSKAQRIAEYDAANPGKSTRDAADDLGVGNATVHRARQTGVSGETPDTVTGSKVSQMGHLKRARPATNVAPETVTGATCGPVRT